MTYIGLLLIHFIFIFLYFVRLIFKRSISCYYKTRYICVGICNLFIILGINFILVYSYRILLGLMAIRIFSVKWGSILLRICSRNHNRFSIFILIGCLILLILTLSCIKSLGISNLKWTSWNTTFLVWVLGFTQQEISGSQCKILSCLLHISFFGWRYSRRYNNIKSPMFSNQLILCSIKYTFTKIFSYLY